MRLDTSLSSVGLVAGAARGGNFSPPTIIVPALTKLVAIGDSITVAEGSYANLYAAARPDLAFANRAWGGWGINNLIDNIATIMAQEDPSHITVLIGANDSGAQTPVQWLSALEELVGAAKAIKPTVQMGACGVLPADEALPGYSGFNANRAAINFAMRSAAWLDFYIPIGDHPTFEDAAAQDPTLSNDGIHWAGSSGRAYATMLEVYSAVMDSILIQASGSIPNAFSFTDVTHAVAESTHTSSVMAAGMGPRAIATVSMIGGGDFRRGHGSFDDEPFTVMNGDVVTARLSASATPAAIVAQTVTIGGVSDTFSVTTAAEVEPLDVTFRGYRGPDPDWTTGSNPSFEDPVQYYAGRNVIGIFVEGWIDALPTGITLDGTAGELLAEVLNPSGFRKIIQFWAVDKDVSGEGELSLSTGSNLRSYGFALWSTSTNAMVVEAETLAEALVHDTSPVLLPSITKPAAGAILYLATIYEASRVVSPASDCTERADFDGSHVGADVRYWAGERDSTGQAGIAFAGQNWAYVQMLGIALEPAAGD